MTSRLLLSWLAISSFFLAIGSSLTSLNLVTIRKPYVHIYDEPSTEPPVTEVIEYDQTNLTCPLPYMSSSAQTGCTCDLPTKQIKCFYSDALWQLPTFVRHSSDSASDWSVDLRCKNFTSINDLGSFLPLARLKLLDMSYDPENLKEICRLKHTSNAILVGLTEFGAFGGQSQGFSDQSLEIRYLNLSGNGLEAFSLNTSWFNVRVEELNLERNQLMLMENTGWLETVGLARLYLRSNQLLQVDVGFLVHLSHLDVSDNRLHQFSIEFYSMAQQRNNEQRSGQSRLSGDENEDNATVVSSSLTSLDFSSNQLTNLPFIHLTNVQFTQLRHLNISINNLEQIVSDEFATMRSLQELILRTNRIDTIEAGGFRGLASLTGLDLAENRLKQVRSDVFKDVGRTLRRLVLDANFFRRVPKAALKYCRQVVELRLFDNQVKVLEEYAFGYMGSLIEVYLGGNLIEEISAKAFHIDPHSLRGPGLLERIDLSSNRLTTLSSSLFAYLVNLRYLQLNNNLIRHIEPDVFSNVNSLIALDLSVNQLTDFDLLFLASSNLRKLRTLKLSHNRLTYIQPSQFICLASLTALDLSANQISQLSDCAFHGLQYSIRNLLLNYNRIVQVNSCAFSLEFNSLRFVQLAHNPLNCSNNCEFFYTVYRTPYSIDYKGIECVNNNFNLITSHSLRYCSLAHYEAIYKSCRSRLFNNDCLLSDNQPVQVEKNQQGCEFQLRAASAGSMSHVNWTLGLGNRSALQEKHRFLYEVVNSYQEVVEAEKTVASNGWRRALTPSSWLIDFFGLVYCLFLFGSLL